MKYQLADLACSDPVKACKLALRRTRHIDHRTRADVCNHLLGMHGVEAIRGEWQNGYWCDIVATYCNNGDMYDTTIIFPRDGRPLVTTLGDWIECNGERYGVQ